MPGYEALDTVSLNDFLLGDSNNVELRPGPILIDGTNGKDGGNTNTYDIRRGWLMGRITATGKYVPLRRTQVNMADATTTSLVVDNSYPFKAGDTISIGSDTGVAVSAVDYTTHTLTIASTAVADNEAVIVADGSGICHGILWESVRLRNYLNTAAGDKHGVLMIGGTVDTSKLYGDVAAMLATLSSHYVKGIKFYTSNVAAG